VARRAGINGERAACSARPTRQTADIRQTGPLLRPDVLRLWVGAARPAPALASALQFAYITVRPRKD